LASITISSMITNMTEEVAQFYLDVCSRITVVRSADFGVRRLAWPLWASRNPKGCQKVAGGHSAAKTSGQNNKAYCTQKWVPENPNPFKTGNLDPRPGLPQRSQH